MESIIVTTGDVGQRVDLFLKEGVFSSEEITRGDVIRTIKGGNVTVNGKIVKPSYILKENDEVCAKMAEEIEEVIENTEMELEIIYQDDDLVVVNKPSGLTVHPTDVEKENTLVNALVVKFPEIRNINDGSQDSWMRPGIVHRLDKDTSGAIAVARNQKTFDELKRKFADREMEKNYVALVYGHLEKESGVIDAPIARSASFKKQKIARGKMKGTARGAVTEYKLLKRYEDYDLVEAYPKTGRMHQIRVHLSSIGNPVVGDEKYKRKDLSIPVGVERHFLHAQKLKFELFGKNYNFDAPLPKDFQDFINTLD